MNKRGPVLIFAIAVAACGGDDAIAIHDLPDAIQNADCDFEVRCQEIPDRATCIEALPFNSTDELTTIADVDAGIIKYDGKLAKSCVDTLSSVSCSFADLEAALAPCNDMFVGTVAVGGACFISTECVDHGSCQQTDPSCDDTTACCVGTCVAVPAKTPIGGACGNTGSGCVTGAYCSIPNGQPAGTCKAQVDTEGGVCDAFNACAAPRQCVIPGTATTGVCKTLPAEGETCDTTTFQSCADIRDFCDVTTSKCTHRADTGEACGGTDNVSCVGYAACDATTLKCVVRPSLGDTCDTMTSTLNCLGDLQCVNTKCAAPPAGFTCPM